ncbi:MULTISPECIES: helix-turn-helix domain-containing protein [Clostridium]|uniref:helix-turn-helix domain-containing protein n=1 Tax=Clostridium sporogenes TaxID=1509 RepID=UPI0002E16245|nr:MULTISPECIES: helix-turn-helix transcriptional regulator [Clostridium]MBO0530365.1 XRE family transcriptional regulator [Clostridium botulinum]MBO0538443.1 XRE family transcriptional regulator [Clostridium botulinum]MBO0550524.1 XRE family transcriptional regulator [Clostridium botulinum]MBO0554878.1 XRE family transcriptional regulator [Clostridium botulinum]MBO0559133.1 XRE family transcriptional regulator [Clostridium botulinum]
MFGDRLKELREEKGMTQEQLGKLLNITKQAVYSYEKGDNEPTIDALVKIADIFNVSLDYLLGRTKERYNLNLKDKKNKELLLDLIKVIEKHKK